MDCDLLSVFIYWHLQVNFLLCERKGRITLTFFQDCCNVMTDSVLLDKKKHTSFTVNTVTLSSYLQLLPVLLFHLDCGVPIALEVLHSSLPRVPCLCLVDRLAGLGLAAGGCESGAPLVPLGDGHPRNLLLLSTHDAPAVVDLLDSACKKSTFSFSPSALCNWPGWFKTFFQISLQATLKTVS